MRRFSSCQEGDGRWTAIPATASGRVVSGNSSGGLLAIQVANEVTELVSSLILEDPPLFTSLHPHFLRTAGYDLPRIAHEFLASEATDFPAYYVQRSAFLALFGDLAPRMTRTALAQRGSRAPQPIRWWSMPPVMNEMFRVLDLYDPHFGEAFFTGAWHEGFDHAEAIAALSVPTVLMHADWQLDETGTTLLGGGTPGAQRSGRRVRLSTPLS